MKIIQKIEAQKEEVNHGFAIGLALDIFDVSPSDLAEHLEISRQHMHRIKETKKLGADRLEKIAHYLGMSTEQLLDIPSHPLSTLIEYQSKKISSYLEGKAPAHGRFIRQIDGHYNEIKNLVAMLEVS